MTKPELLELLKLLSALESWSFGKDVPRIPDYLHEWLGNSVELITKEILK